MNKSSKHSNPVKSSGISDLAVKATRALARGQRQVTRENARYGLPLIVVQNGPIVAVPTGKAAPARRRYKSIADLIKGEGVSHEVGKQVTALANETGIVRQLVQLRVRAGLTQAELAERIGCTQSRVSKMESSPDSDLTLGNLCDYMKATESSINIVCGKPVGNVEAVKMHAFSIKM